MTSEVCSRFPKKFKCSQGAIVMFFCVPNRAILFEQLHHFSEHVCGKHRLLLIVLNSISP
jgi:hypothetical protein